VPSRRTRDSNAQVGFGLGEVKPLRAVGKHGRRGLAGVQPTRIHLGAVGHEVGLDPSRLTKELGQTAEQVLVRDGLEIGILSHARVWSEGLPQEVRNENAMEESDGVPSRRSLERGTADRLRCDVAVEGPTGVPLRSTSTFGIYAFDWEAP